MDDERRGHVTPVRPVLHQVASSHGTNEHGACAQPEASDGVEAQPVVLVAVLQ